MKTVYWRNLYLILFLSDLMHKLDSIDEIKEKGIYQIRSISSKKHTLFLPPELKYFDFETQTIKYAYHIWGEDKRKNENVSKE